MLKSRLKELRLAKKMTQNELAKAVGVTQAAIYKLEKGERDLDLTWMAKLAPALNIKPYELLPKEWQPETLSEEEQQILAIFRKNTTSSQKRKKK